MSNPSYKFCLSKWYPLEFNSLSSSSPPGTFWWLPRSENGSLWWPSWVWCKGKKITRCLVGWEGRLLQHGDVKLSKKLPDAQGVVSRRVVVVKQPGLVLPQFSPLHLHWTKKTPHGFFVDMLVDRLTLWQELCGRCPSHRSTRSTWVWLWTSLSCFLQPWWLRTLPLKDLWLITGDDTP